MEDKVATKVYDTFELELENGESVLIKPLPIKALRKFMELVNKEDAEDEILIRISSAVLPDSFDFNSLREDW